MPWARNLNFDFCPGLVRRLHGVVEDADEFVADDLAFALGIGDALELFEEARGGVHVFEFDVKVVAEDALHGLGFVGAEEAVVDEDAGELVADGLVQKRGGDAGIDAAAEAEDDVIVADLLRGFPRRSAR